MNKYLRIKRLKKNFNEIEFIKHHSELFKYREWKDNSYHQKVLLKNELYFPEPESFHDENNDPNDCIIKLKRLSKLEIEKVLQNFYKKRHLRFNDSAISLLVQTHPKSHFEDFNTLEKQLKQFDSAFNKKVGILCLTHNPLNYTMWEKYSSNHTGICYGFKSENLYNDLSENGTVTRVLYATPKPEWNPLDEPEINVFRRIYCKDFKYKYEEEYRLKKTEVVNRVSRFHNTTLECIFVGASMSEVDKEEVISIIKEKHLNVRLYQCKYYKNNQLSFYEISTVV